MSHNQAIRPENILPDGIDSTEMQGQTVRKGIIAAFLANIDILENPTIRAEQKQAALNMMRELASAVVAIGLHKHVAFHNTQAEQILVEAAAL